MRAIRTILPCSMIMAAVLVGSPAHAAELFDTNVLQNPGGEEGTTGWAATGGAGVLPYGAPGTSSCHDGGNNHFVGLAHGGPSYLEQTIDLSSGAATVDRGGVGVRMIGTLGSSSSAWASLYAEYLNASGDYITAEWVSGTYYSACGGALATNQFYEDIVPIGTRSIRFRVYLPPGGWADDVSLTLVPPPFADLATRGSSSGAWAGANAPFTHTFTVRNLGPDVASAAHLFVTPPAGAKVTSSPGCYVSVVPPDPKAPSVYTCEIGALGVGQSAVFAFTMRAVKKGTYTTSAHSYDPDDRNGANDNATATTSMGAKYVPGT